MRIFKTKAFHRWASKEKLTDNALCIAVDEIVNGLIDANLGGHVLKKRVALAGRGKRGGYALWWLTDWMKRRSLCAKGEQANITQTELKALKLLAAELLGYSNAQLAKVLNSGELIEVIDNG